MDILGFNFQTGKKQFEEDIIKLETAIKDHKIVVTHTDNRPIVGHFASSKNLMLVEKEGCENDYPIFNDQKVTDLVMKGGLLHIIGARDLSDKNLMILKLLFFHRDLSDTFRVILTTKEVEDVNKRLRTTWPEL